MKRTVLLRQLLGAMGILTIAACGDDDPTAPPPTVTRAGSTVRVHCGGGDCAIAVVQDGGFLHVSATRTHDAEVVTTGQQFETITNLLIETEAGSDSIVMVDAFIPGTLRIVSGAGDDSFDLCDTSVRGDVRINTGPGNDAPRLAPGTYGGSFRMDLGDGDDSVEISGGRFARAMALDGGSGIDTTSIDSVTFVQAPEIVGFEP
jgi:hypothetical protein